jgi:iron complex outermembrane receptor protein
MRNFIFKECAVSVLSLLLCSIASAAEINGQVNDPVGAAIARALVRVTQADRVISETTSDAVGHYILTVPPGSYVVVASAPHLQAATRALQIAGEGDVTADFTLALPAVEQTVTVEANVAQASLEQIPGNTALVEQETIRNSLAITLKDVLGFTPGVLVQPRFGADESQFSIRGSGLRSNFHERGVNLFINGTPYQDADGFSDFEAIELQAVREVEVWKGANALRYGGNTSGGAVNFITYTGENSSPLQVSVEGGSYGLFKSQLSSGGRVGPLSYFLSLSETEIGGYREHSHQGRQRLYGNLGWRLTDRTSARMDWIYVNAAEQLPGALTRQEFLADPQRADPGYVTDNWGRFQNAVHVGFDVNHQIDDRQEIEVIAYGQYRKLYHPIYQILDQDTRTFGGEVRYRYAGTLFGHGDRFVAGFVAQVGTQGDRNYENILGQPGPLAALYGDRSRNWGFYFDNQFDIRPGLTFVTGGRGDIAYRRYEDHFLSDGDQSDHRTYRAFSPKFGLTWQISDQVQMFGNISRSYEPPLMFELTSFGAPGFLPLKPQDTWQYEIGTRGNWTNHLNWDLAFFDLEVSNELLNVNLVPYPGAPFTFPSYRNAPARHLGFETGLGTVLKNDLFRQRDRLSFRAAYTYAHYTFRGDPIYGDNSLPGQPRHLLRAELRYQHPTGLWIAPMLDWSPADYFVNSANTARNDQYAAFNLKAGYDWRKFGLFLEAANLTDRYYSGSVQVDAGDGRFYEPANRRSVYGGVRWHF